jgi:hypothetical protein
MAFVRRTVVRSARHLSCRNDKLLPEVLAHASVAEQVYCADWQLPIGFFVSVLAIGSSLQHRDPKRLRLQPGLKALSQPISGGHH